MQVGPPEPKRGSLLLMGAGPGSGGAAGVAEVTQVSCPGQVESAIDSSGFDIDSAEGVKTVRINDVADVSVTLGPDATEAEVGQAVKEAMELTFPTLWIIDNLGGILTITDQATGARTDAAQVGGQFNVSVMVQGS